MADRPILFNAPMVRALIEGRKTQTRRIMKPQPIGNGFIARGEVLTLNDFLPPDAMLLSVGKGRSRYTTSSYEGWESACPYGQPGDLLWVRETFQPLFADGWEEGRNPDGSGDRVNYKTGEGYAPHYVADCGRIEFVTPDGDLVTRCTPPIRMPRWASRLTLRITDVRVQRLNDISEADALAEGVTPKWEPGCSGRLMEAFNGFSFRPAASAYADLWEQINGAGSWEANPWAWALTFDVIPRNVDDVLLELANAEVTP